MIRRTFAVFFSCLLIASIAAAQPRPDDMADAVRLVGNGELAAQLGVGTAQERITGRVSFDFVLTGERVVVQGFNVVFFGVPQKMISGNAPAVEPLGVLAFGVARDKPQTLRYDSQKRIITGTLRMFADASFLSLLARPEGDGKDDQFETPVLPATATISISVAAGVVEGKREGRSVSAGFELAVRTESTRVSTFTLPPYELMLREQAFIKIDIGPFPFFESARRLCVQPVRVMRLVISGFTFFLQTTGAGLAFGQPGANAQWAKADVVFTYRDWKTFFAPSFFVVDSSEETALRSLVEDDDCVEVFFIQDFNPEDAHGGGVTFGAGTASTQVISSDANAKFGIDQTHLAHELGHVLGLRHPTAPPTASAVPANTGTLLCPSGFKNDNPKVNSQGNSDLLSNPLLTFAIKVITPGPDCLDSADCGPCP